MFEQKIVRIEQANLLGERPRKAGCNSRLGEHGLYVRPSIVTITTDQGAFGFGASRISQSEAEKVLGKSVGEIFQNDPKRMSTIIYVSLELIRKLSIMLYPIIPESASKVLSVFNIS